MRQKLAPSRISIHRGNAWIITLHHCMNADKKTLFLPILVIAIGAGWLVSALGYAPNIDWLWTISLALAGIATLLVGGIDKVTVVVGPFFLAASGLSILRQTDRLSFQIELPVLVILVGLLLLVARSPAVPAPKWASDDAPRSRKDD
jgi:hypothetical protein